MKLEKGMEQGWGNNIFPPTMCLVNSPWEVQFESLEYAEKGS